MNHFLTPRRSGIAVLALCLIATTTPAIAEPAAGGAGNGTVWLATFSPNQNTPDCTPLSTTPPITTCDLPWSAGHARSAIAQFNGTGGQPRETVTIILPFIRDYTGPIQNYNAPRLLVSDFAGSATSSEKGLVLNVVSVLAVAVPAGYSCCSGGDFGSLVLNSMLTESAGTFSGPFVYSLLDRNGKPVFQGTGTLTLVAFPGFGGGVSQGQ